MGTYMCVYIYIIHIYLMMHIEIDKTYIILLFLYISCAQDVAYFERTIEASKELLVPIIGVPETVPGKDLVINTFCPYCK